MRYCSDHPSVVIRYGLILELKQTGKKHMSFKKSKLFLVVLLACVGFSAASIRVALAASKEFVTPTGNILCRAIEDTGGYGNFIACELRSRKDAVPLQPRPADCGADMDWGGSFTVPEVGRSELNCYHGGTLPAPNAVVLKYGKTFSFHGISCKSQTNSLTCRNSKGRGFAISRSEQRLF